MLALTASFLSSFTWAVGTQTYSRLAKNYPPYVINFNRAAFALPLFLLAFLIEAGPAEFVRGFEYMNHQSVMWLGISMLGSYAFADALFFFSARDLGVPIALSIAALYPLWSALAGWIWNGETLTGVQWMGLCFAVAGVIIVILSGAKKRKLEPAHAPKSTYHRGVALAFITSFLWSLNTYSVARGGVDVPPLLASAVRMMFAITTGPLIGFFMGPRGPLIFSRGTYVKNAWVFIFESFGGSFFYLYGLTHAPLAMASALSSLAPVLAVPIEWQTTRRRPPMDTTFGICLVIGGVILLVLK